MEGVKIVQSITVSKEGGNGEDVDWDGEERREAKRRYTTDRRRGEARKRIWVNIVLPAIVGIGLTSLLSWAIYVTHTTYTISAIYDQTFKKHIDSQAVIAAKNAAKLKEIATDSDKEMKELRKIHVDDMRALRSDMSNGFREIRNTQGAIYDILVKRVGEGEKKNEDDDKKYP
jgi:hypothetical protein